MLLSVVRLAAWLVISLLVLFTIVPPSLRPTTAVSHYFEHFASFAFAGTLYYLAYAGPLARQLLIAVLFSGGIELLQNFVPGRHSRVRDFVVDAAGGCIGMVVGFTIRRIVNARQIGSCAAPLGIIVVRGDFLFI
jgi:VanZ family protein